LCQIWRKDEVLHRSSVTLHVPGRKIAPMWGGAKGSKGRAKANILFGKLFPKKKDVCVNVLNYFKKKSILLYFLKLEFKDILFKFAIETLLNSD
jgi:hypothetical protein